MKELFRFTSIQKLANLITEPFGKINLDEIQGEFYSAAITKNMDEVPAIADRFFKSAAFNPNPADVDKSLTAIYKELYTPKKYTVEDILDLCQKVTGSDIGGYVRQPAFMLAKNTIVENLFFLSAVPDKTTGKIKVLYKQLLKTIGLLEAIDSKDEFLHKIIANPGLQYYEFGKGNGVNDIGKKNYKKEDAVKLTAATDDKLKKEIDYLAALKNTKSELLQHHTENKSRITKEQLNATPASTIQKKSKKGFWASLFGSYQDEVKETTVVQQLFENPLLLKGINITEKSKLTLQTLSIDATAINTYATINRLEEEIVNKSNTLYTTLNKQNSTKKRKSLVGFESMGDIRNLKTEDYMNIISVSDINGSNGTPVTPKPIDTDVSENLPATPDTVGYAKILGEGLLLRVEEKYKGCVTANLSAVVNIPPFAKKSYENRYLSKVVATSTSDSMVTSQDETSTETKESTTLSNEVNKIINTDSSLQAGLNISASYGPTVGVEASTNVSSNLSNSESVNSASSYAKDVTQRAVQKIEKMSRDSLKTEKTTENEITSIENYENLTGNPAIGIYQFINEVYTSRLVQYDARLLLEFMVPEPGSVLLYAAASPNISPDNPPPKAPKPFDIGLDDILPETYKEFIKIWGASDVTPPPPQFITIGKSLAGTPTPKRAVDGAYEVLPQEIAVTDEIELPKEYIIDSIVTKITTPRNLTDHISYGPQPFIIDIGGNITRSIWFDPFPSRSSSGREHTSIVTSEMMGATKYIGGKLPISVSGFQAITFTLLVDVHCRVSAAAMDSWKIDTYKKLQQAYQVLLSDFNDKLALSRQRTFLSGGSLGKNPENNRKLEKDELKRGCISILTQQSFENFDATNDPGDEIPIIRFDQAKPEGEYVSFFENAFEWTQLTYILYPYFWANPDKTWMRSLKLSVDDAKHEEFLKAGFSRVVVPVRPEFQSAVINYIRLGKIWDGRDPDEIGIDDNTGNYDPMYVTVWQEIMERQGQLQREPKIIDEWEYELPTNHQIISNGLPIPFPKPFI